jgi:hypothetical protein
VERGLYAGQISELLTLFPRHQVYFYRTDALWRTQEQVLRDVQKFLNVDEKVGNDRRYIVPVDTTDLGTLPPAARARLDEMFAEDIRATASLTGLDLADWLEPSYEESIGEGD